MCNNDSTIKVYRLPDMYRLTTIQTPVPSNYTALSPDRSLLLSVGDCTNGTIYQARESGEWSGWGSLDITRALLTGRFCSSSWS